MFVSLVVSPQSLYICIVKINYQNKLLMKRFTITTLLIALYSMMMVAQVTPPSTATSETWYTVDGKFYAYSRHTWSTILLLIAPRVFDL